MLGKQPFWGVMAILLCSIFTACSDGGETTNIGCNSDADCPAGQICNSGTCALAGDYSPADTDLSGIDGDDLPTDVECYQDAECDEGYVCRDNFCIPQGIDDGDWDYDSSPSESDKEVELDRIPCTKDADCSDGEFCNGDESCGPDLFCRPGSDPCDDGIECTFELCDEETNSCSSETDDSVCNDNNPCNGLEYCDSSQGCQPGVAQDCDDGLACTDDSCSESEGCLNIPNNALCDDSVDCTDDACSIDDGGCVHVPLDSSCDDGILCTTDRCDPVQGCRYSPNNLACDDGFTCTEDTCNAQTDCVNTPRHELCAATELCGPTMFGADPTSGCAPKPECAIDEDCDDGKYCTGVETCVNGFCQPGTIPDCSDGIDCTDDICHEDTHLCSHVANDERCQNETVCDGREICAEATGCMPGPPLNCDDNFECTEDSCDAAEGCRYVATDSNCNDKIACTIDRCSPENGDPVTGCVNQPDNTFCDDHVDCTTNICDVAAEGCVFNPNDSACDDGLDCTNDLCSAQYGCTHEVDNSACADGVDCTLDLCEIGVGCSNIPDDSICSPLICHPERGCIDTPRCETDAECDDGNVCNGVETCIDEYCEPGTDIDCSDGIGCTVDSCSPQNGCIHTPDHQVCDDSDDCTGDICDVDEDCIHIVVKDSDNDYYLDADCEGGNDCDDTDPDVHPGATEICDDNKDNDCNGLEDEEDPVCAPCAGSCPAGMECCGTTCVDILYNNDHCGGCDIPCATACFKGDCLAPGKCADALKRLITGNVRYDNENTCGDGNEFQAGGCSVTASGQEHMYAIRPVSGNPMRITMYPWGSEIENETLYLMSDCRDPNSCFEYDYNGTSSNYITLDTGNGGEIFFAVADFRMSDCGYYDIKVDYDYEPSDCNQGSGLLPVSGQGAFWINLLAFLLFALWMLRRRNA